jgi:predicted nucleic acid-binding protein
VRGGSGVCGGADFRYLPRPRVIRGITLRSTIDCLIAQQALEDDAMLLHDDDDFERMREVRSLKTLRS